MVVQGGHSLRGDVEVPADRSITHRALMFAGVSDGRSSIRARSPGNDTRFSAGVIAQLGARVSSDTEGWLVEGIGLNGLRSPEEMLHCGNSKICIDLFAGLLSGARVEAVLAGHEVLHRLPVDSITKPLRAVGARIEGMRAGGKEFPPLRVDPANLKKPEIVMELASPETKSAVLLAGLTAGAEIRVTEPTPSRDHTERMLRARGVDVRVEVDHQGRSIRLDPPRTMAAIDVDIPGDFSSAALFLAAGSIVPDSEIRVRNVGLNPGRTGLLEVFEELQARCTVSGWREIGGEPAGDVTAQSADLVSRQDRDDATVVAGGDIPRLIDELVVLAAVAARAEGRLEVFDARELRGRQYDRILEIARLLKAFGVEMDQWDDGFAIEGRQRFTPADVEVSSDHRVALSAIIMALATEGRSVLRGFDRGTARYLAFVEELRSLGAKITVEA